jgi:flagellar biosynthesis regulator FlbT
MLGGPPSGARHDRLGAPMSFTLTVESVREMLDDDTTLQTLKNQYTAAEVFEMLKDVAEITSEDALFEALMDVMYATRPEGHV